MARTLNRVQLIGRLGADPEMRYTSSGMAVTTFSLATDRQWQDKEGNTQEETDWHNIVAWDRLAQICGEHLSKGRLVFIEGRLRHRSWESNGQKHYRTEVVATDMLILDSKGALASAATPNSEAAPARTAEKATSVPARGQSKQSVLTMDEDDPEDLPF